MIDTLAPLIAPLLAGGQAYPGFIIVIGAIQGGIVKMVDRRKPRQRLIYATIALQLAAALLWLAALSR